MLLEMCNGSLSIFVVFLQKACASDRFDTISAALSFNCVAHSSLHNYLTVWLLRKIFLEIRVTVVEKSVLWGKNINL